MPGFPASAEGHRQSDALAMPVEDGPALHVHAGAKGPAPSVRVLCMSSNREEFT